MIFEEALKRVFEHEGGYSDHALDPGGKTKYGITEAVAREWGYAGPMKDLPRDLAARIYRVAYWDCCRCDSLPEAIRYSVFDAAVNQGPEMAVIFLQRAVKIDDDGILGPKTLACVRQMNPEPLVVRFYIARMRHYTKLGAFKVFGKGWTNRALDGLAEVFGV